MDTESAFWKYDQEDLAPGFEVIDFLFKDGRCVNA